MKKIIALVVALVMMAAIAVPAFAQVVSGSDATAESLQLSGGTTIIYGTSQQYTVTIPVTIDLNGQTPEGEVTVSDYSLAADKQLTISVNTSMLENYDVKNDNKWYLFEDTTQTTTGATDVEYTITIKNGAAVARGGNILSADTTNGNAPVTTTLVFATEGTSQVAAFTDTIVFTASIGALN